MTTSTGIRPIPLNDTRPQYEAIGAETRAAMDAVLERSWFILGEEVASFEREFADFCGVKHCVGVSNGTDAIHISVRALGIGPGDEVILPTHTATFSALGISMSGATPRLVDVEADTGNIAPRLIEAAITPATRAIMPVHLYGQAADMDPIREVAARHGLPVVEDAAQAHGATYRGGVVGSIGRIGCFSFYPTKNLGAYGDGGALTTDDDELAGIMRELRHGGQRDRYHHERLGFCNRLDEIQAAVLRVKLRYLRAWNEARAERAAHYTKLLAAAGNPVTPLAMRDYGRPVYHLYVVRTPRRRAELTAALKAAGIDSYIHYPVPVHLQQAYGFLGQGAGSFPVAESLAESIVSLPLYPELAFEDIERVVEVIAGFYG
ncbi:MAG: DegT/DnrJ/EryC1/StrS family aminotransferase [Chloroflexia bacterium]